jgi:hypothetical protein
MPKVQAPLNMIHTFQNDNGEGNDGDDDSEDSDDENSIHSPVSESWEVHADGSLELMTKSASRQNKFEKSKTSAFVPTTKSSSLSSSSSSSSSTQSITSCPSSKDNLMAIRSKKIAKFRESKFERLRKKKGKIQKTLEATTTTTTTTTKGAPTPTGATTKDKVTNVTQVSTSSTSTPVKENKFKKLKEELEHKSELTIQNVELKQSMTKLQRKLQKAKSHNSHRKLRSEISRPDSNQTCHGEEDKEVEESSSATNSQSIDNDQTRASISKNTRPRSVSSSFSTSTRTTAGTSSFSPSRNSAYTVLNTKRLKEKLLKKKNEKDVETLTLESPDNKLINECNDIDIPNDFDALSSPPHVKRRADLSLLSDKLDYSTSREKLNISFIQKESETFEQHDENVDTDFLTEILLRKVNEPSFDESIHSPASISSKCHKINISIELSSSSAPALKKMMNEITSDLQKYHSYQYHDESNISMETSCFSESVDVTPFEAFQSEGHSLVDPSPSQSSPQTPIASRGCKFETPVRREKNHIEINTDLSLCNITGSDNDSDVLSIPTSSLIRDFRQAVNSLQNHPN